MEVTWSLNSKIETVEISRRGPERNEGHQIGSETQGSARALLARAEGFFLV